MPETLTRFLTKVQWRSLALDKLPPAERKEVVSFLEEVFEGEDPAKLPPKDIEEVMGIARKMSRDLAICADHNESGISKDDFMAAKQTVSELLRADRERPKKRGRP